MKSRKASNFFWNYSIDDNYKIFFDKNKNWLNTTHKFDNNLKFIVWDVKDNIKIEINNRCFENLKEWTINDSEIFVKDVSSLFINGKDYTSIYKNIYRNLIRI